MEHLFIDPLGYIPTPRFNLAEGISLSHSLVAATPADPTEALLRYRDQLIAHANLLGKEWAAREKNDAEQVASEARPADLRLDCAVRAVHDRIAAAGALPAERHPDATQAKALVATLFGEGLGWLTLRFDEEWAHAAKLLERIDAEGHAAAIDRIAGPEYLAELREAHQQYGKVLGKTEAKPGVEPVSFNMLDGLKELSRIIGGYTLQALAMADETRPETVEAVRAALRPIEEFKSAAARSRRAAGDKAVSESAPTTP